MQDAGPCLLKRLQALRLPGDIRTRIAKRAGFHSRNRLLRLSNVFDTFNEQGATIDRNLMIERPVTNIDVIFTSFYNTFNIEFKQTYNNYNFLERRKIKTFSQPWITQGLRISIDPNKK